MRTKLLNLSFVHCSPLAICIFIEEFKKYKKRLAMVCAKSKVSALKTRTTHSLTVSKNLKPTENEQNNSNIIKLNFCL